ncbi:MAG: NAD-dependent epimerase/dehydratase family protein [Hyphomicrobiales bacterium]
MSSKSIENKTVLVTGGTGLVGSHLLYDLIRKGYKVRALKRKTSNLSNTKDIFSHYSEDSTELFNSLEWIDGDILDVFSLEGAMKGVDHVYHAAAMVSFEGSDKSVIHKVNTDGTANIVNVALQQNVKKLGFVSSIASLGRANEDGIITEECWWKNSSSNSQYSISKFGAEREVWRGIAEGLDAIIINPSIILGPSDWNNSSSQIFKTVYDGIKFYTNGITGFIDVRDVSASLLQLMESDIKNDRFIINSEDISYKKIFDLIAHQFNVKIPNFKVAPWQAAIVWRLLLIKSLIFGGTPRITKETARSAFSTNSFSNKKVSEYIGYNFIPIEQSVHDTCQYFIRNYIHNT